MQELVDMRFRVPKDLRDKYTKALAENDMDRNETQVDIMSLMLEEMKTAEKNE